MPMQIILTPVPISHLTPIPHLLRIAGAWQVQAQ